VREERSSFISIHVPFVKDLLDLTTIGITDVQPALVGLLQDASQPNFTNEKRTH
jgi:hypothetical protein